MADIVKITGLSDDNPKPSQLDVTLQLSYATTDSGDRAVVIQITDARSLRRLMELSISGLEFTNLLSTLGARPAGMRIWKSIFGAQREQKHEIVPFNIHTWPRSTQAIQSALAPFEVDGWRGSEDQLTNPHCRTDGGQRVLFTRIVGDDGKPIELS